MTDPAEGLERYLVGGAVRDHLLGLPVRDRDWVVVGADVEEMKRRGFRPVGRDFPVFLHPQTHEEHALARTERKTAPGYTGFVFHAAADVTLEQDLSRRDLTINAVAMNERGEYIDPHGGIEDARRRLLRHVSPAFVEDPVRVLRVARLAARYAGLGFTVAAETRALMVEMVRAGEVDALVAERVWQELNAALAQPRPSPFFLVLRDCSALARILPEIDALFGIPQPARYHPEIDTGVHTMMVVDQVTRLSEDPRARFAALVHDLGKACTPVAELPSHRGHEHRGLAVIDALCDRLRVPGAHRALARGVCRYHLHLHRLEELKPATIVRMLEALDVFRRPDRLEPFLAACEADARGRLGMEDLPWPQGDRLRRCYQVARAVDAAAIAAEVGGDGAMIALRLHQERARAVSAILDG